MQLSIALDLFFISMEGVLSSQTVAWYRSKLKGLCPIYGHMDVTEINTDDLRAWRASLASRMYRWDNHPTRCRIIGNLSPYTIHCHVRAVKRFFNWLFEEGHLSVNPAARLEKPPLPSPLRRGISEENALKILEAAKASPRDYAMVLIFADSGCRLAGIAGLQIDALELAANRAFVWEKGKGGNHKGRYIYFSAVTVSALRAWLAIRPIIKSNHVFIGLKRGGDHKGWHELTPNGIYKAMKRLADLAGVRWGWNPHNWRHACIRHWLESNMPLGTASQLAGHSSEQITSDIYGVFAENELQAAHQRASWVSEMTHCHKRQHSPVKKVMARRRHLKQAFLNRQSPE